MDQTKEAPSFIDLLESGGTERDYQRAGLALPINQIGRLIESGKIEGILKEHYIAKDIQELILETARRIIGVYIFTIKG